MFLVFSQKQNHSVALLGHFTDQNDGFLHVPFIYCTVGTPMTRTPR